MIRIIVVADNLEVAASVERELERTGTGHVECRVGDLAELKAALGGPFEAVVFDHHTKDVTLAQVFAVFGERGSELPVIVVSDEADEEVAVETLKQGAADYLHRDRLGRLGSSIRRAIEQKRLQAEEHRARERFRLLAEAGAVLSSSLDFEATLDNLARLVIPKMGDWCTVDLLDDGELRRVATGHSEAERVQYSEKLAERYATVEQRGRMVSDVLESGRALLVPEVTDAMLVASAHDEDHLELLRGIRMRSKILVPLAARGRTIGLMTFLTSESERTYDENDLRVAQELADRAALAVENSLLYREAEKARRVAESANQTKSQFLANMSHEIRTPLGAVLGFAELMLNPQQAASDRRECVMTILRNGRQLLSLIDDILDLSKVEAGKLEIDDAPVALTDLSADIAGLLRAQADTKGLYLRFETEGPVPVTIHTDQTRLRQVLINVIGNALKFTERGGVTVRVKVEEDDASDRSLLYFYVTDTGRGLNAEERRRIFQPFVQANSATKRQYGGTGLGLVLSRMLATAMGGDVRLVASEPGKGSTFVVSIDPGEIGSGSMTEQLVQDRAVPDPVPAPRDDRGQLAGLHLLLVDDAPDNRLLISKFLKIAGARVDLAVNGREGVASAIGGDYDLVLMDIQMPEVDGYQAMSELRGKGYGKPIVALTAHAMKDEEGKCRRAGCDGYLTKPVDRKALIQTVADLCQANRSSSAQPRNVTPEPLAETTRTAAHFVNNDGDDPVIQRIVNRFMRSAFPEHLNLLRAAIASGDWNEVARIGHLLKGSVGAHNYPDLGSVAEQIESEARGDARRDLLEKYLTRLSEFHSGGAVPTSSH